MMREGTTHIVLKFADAFLVADEHGDLPLAHRQSGLYRRGNCFLHTCNLYLDDFPLMALSHQIATTLDACTIQLTNASITHETGNVLKQGSIVVTRALHLEQDALVQTLIIANTHAETLSLTISLEVSTSCPDLFFACDVPYAQCDGEREEAYSKRELVLYPSGRDEIECVTRMQFEPAFDELESGRVNWQLTLQPGESIPLYIKALMSESKSRGFTMQPTRLFWSDPQHRSLAVYKHLFLNHLLPSHLGTPLPSPSRRPATTHLLQVVAA
ncbi:hypothetical protein KSC_043690 [Ktedonobacter sp. SOSP1-52]|nr:hypothetical protein KSC_043690 [Ktedonobacter sp. SOSP1-52]